MSKQFFFGAFQVWHLRASADGGSRIMSASGDRETQEKEMGYWQAQLPDALLVYRTYHARGTPEAWMEEELPLDRTLDTLPRTKVRA